MQAMRSLEGAAAGAAETVQVQQQAAARRMADFDAEVDRYRGQRQARQKRTTRHQEQDDMCKPFVSPMSRGVIWLAAWQHLSSLLARPCCRCKYLQAALPSLLSELGAGAGNPDHLAQMYAPAILASCTQEGAEVVGLRQGSLNKRNRTGLKSWDRRFFTLDSAAVLSYHSSRSQAGNGLRPRQVAHRRAPAAQCNTLHAAV